MQESLRETRRGLERSLDAQAASERTRRQLEAQLEETRKKYDDVFRAKLKLENAKLDMELQVCESVCCKHCVLVRVVSMKLIWPRSTSFLSLAVQ